MEVESQSPVLRGSFISASTVFLLKENLLIVFM